MEPILWGEPNLIVENNALVGGFNPSEKYLSNWIIAPNRDEHQKYLKPPPKCMVILRGIFHFKNAF